MSALASLRVSARCPQCKLPLIVPEWSERISDQKTVHFWHCPMCGHDFESVDNGVPKATVSDDEVVDGFFISLLVA